MSSASGRTPPECLHCGSPIVATLAPAGFCCAGCAQVHALITGCGLGKYYDLRDGRIAPVSSAHLEQRDFSALIARVEEAEQPGGACETRLGLRGVSCIGCVWLIEKIFSEQPGSVSASVNPHAGSVRLRWIRGEFDIADFAARLRDFGYLVTPTAPRVAETEGGLALRLGLCGAFAMNTMLNTVPTYLGMAPEDDFARLFHLLVVAFATLSMLVGGSLFIGRAARALMRGELHMDLPVALGLVAAYLASFAGWWLRRPDLEYWDFVSLFTFLMLVGRMVQERAVEHNRLRLPELNPLPDSVAVYDDADAPEPARRVNAEAVKAGDILGVAPGSVTPVCGRLVGTETCFNLAWINGESEPMPHPPGRLVPAGAVNVSQREARLVSGEDWSASMLNRLVNAGGDGAFTPRLARRVLSTYLVVVIIVAALGFGIRIGLTGDWPGALQRAVSVLVVSCPCSIGLAFPLATELAVARLRRGGVHVRDNRLWERLSRVRRAVFDKTGTLTLELPELLAPERLAELPHEARAALFRLVENNLHPVGRSLREALAAYPESRPAPDAAAPAVVETPGRGVSLTDDSGILWSLGRPTGEGRDAELRRSGEVVARFSFGESVRPGAREEIAAFARNGVEVYVLSGDRQEKVARTLAELGLPPERGLGDLSPEDKARRLDVLGGEGCLMFGDGANDALAFTRAGLRGTPVVDRGLLEQKADFYLLGRGLSGLGLLFRVASARARALRAVFIFAIAYNVAVVALSLAGHMSPLLAAILMPSSAVLTMAYVTRRLRHIA